MKITKILLSFILMAVGILLVTCFYQRKPTESLNITELPTFSTPTYISNASLTPRPTLLPTDIHTATRMPLPNNTSTPLRTPLPTLTLRQSVEKINELNVTNGGCQLPCWWGLIPAKTKISEAFDLLSTFSEFEQGENGNFYENGKEHSATNFTVYYLNSSKKESWRLLLSVSDELISSIEILPPDTQQNYKLNQILTTFGMPNQIYVSAQPDSQTNVLDPARIILDYGALGIWAVFEFPVTKNTKTMVICPRPVGARLSLWDPTVKNSNSISIEEFVDRITGFSPHKLEDVSEMSIQGFYNNFKNANPENCLETPIDLWP